MKVFLILVPVLALGVLCSCSRIESDWKAATETNSAESYSAFLAKHPESEHKPAAQESIAWLTARKTDTIPGYFAFQKEHPKSVHNGEVPKLVEPHTQPVLHDLMSRVGAWDEADNALVESLLALSPNNPYVHFLSGVRFVLKHDYESAQRAFETAKANTTDEQVSEYGMFCSSTFVGPSAPYLSTISISAVQPPEGGPSPDMLGSASTSANFGSGFAPKGVHCSGTMLLLNEKADSPRRMLKYWVERYLGQLVRKCGEKASCAE